MTNGISYQVVREGQEEVMRLNYEKVSFIPSLEDNPVCMADTIDKLVKIPSIARLVFSQRRNYNYSYEQTQMLVEIAQIYNHLVRQKRVFSLAAIGADTEELIRFYAGRFSNINYIVSRLLREDPIGAYVELKRLIREERIRLQSVELKYVESMQAYIDLLQYVYNILDKTGLIREAKPYLEGHNVGDREIYRRFFRATITPDFMYTRLMAQLPLTGEELEVYKVGDADITLLSISEDIKYLYHLNPPEFKINEDHYELLDIARNILAEHKPREEEFLDPEKMRVTFFNIGRDLLQELADHKNIEVGIGDLDKLASILVRYTVGFGLIEVLLDDKRVQDITINGPIGQTPIFIVHQDYDECVTNIIPSREDAEGWASKFRLLSGRPLDEANPVLDTELSLPGSRARVAVITSPLNPYGLAYAFRRHRDEPWTLPLFIRNRMLNSLAAGLISFMIDGARTFIVAGTRSSGKTSVLGSMMVEIMRKYRIITVEDTLELQTEAMRKLGYNIQAMKVRAALAVGGTEMAADEGIRTSLRLGDSSLIVGEVRSSIRGDEEVVVVDKGIMNRVQIKDLENRDIDNIYVPTIDYDLRVKLSKLTNFVKHPKREKLLRIKTKTGREVTVTHDHSLFAPTKNFEIAPVECKVLKVGDKIVIPSFMPCGFNDIHFINVFDYLPEFRVQNFESDVRKAINILGWRKTTEICNINCGDVYNYFRTNQKTNIPFNSFNSLMTVADIGYDVSNLKVKSGSSLSIPAIIPVNEEFCRFLGYYVSEGYYSLKEKNGGKIIITNSNPEIMEDISSICKSLFDLSTRRRVVKGIGTSVQHRLDCLPLTKLISKLGCGRICTEKRVPSIIFSLSKNKIAAFLRALYSGDGSFTSSESTGNSIRYFSTSKKLVEDVLYLLLNFGIVGRIREKKPSGRGKHNLWILEFKDRKMVETFLDKIGFIGKNPKMIIRKHAHTTSNSLKFDKEILRKHLIKYPRKYRHLFRFLRCSKSYLEKVVLDPNCKVSEKIKTFALGDFFVDEVKEIEEIELESAEYVYDLSVEPSQNFIGGFGGILLHNTEAKSLYEAMRVGALANVVAGTIHGDSPYGVFDRVVNDLGVPRTSFKATDIVIIANPIRSPDGMHKWRRVTQITEVRKHWEDDPLREKGFVDLMTYNPKTDLLEPSADLINGDSDVLKNIAGSVKEWAGNWEGIWDNVILRAKIKQTLVDYSDKLKRNDLLEAGFVVQSNDTFHRISDKVKEEVGYLDSKRIFFDWEEWLKRKIKLM